MSNEELVTLYQNGYSGALDKIVEQNQGIVHKLAQRFAVNNNKSMDMDDLLQEGNMGLIRAAGKYNPNHENKAKFTTYAVHWINMRLYRYFSNNHISTDLETSLNAPVHSEEGQAKELVDFIEGVDYSFENIEEMLFRKQLREELEEVMKESNTLQEREVLKLHYGWYAADPIPLDDVGEILKLNGSMARNIEKRALRKIRSSRWGLIAHKKKHAAAAMRNHIFNEVQPYVHEHQGATEQRRGVQ